MPPPQSRTGPTPDPAPAPTQPSAQEPAGSPQGDPRPPDMKTAPAPAKPPQKATQEPAEPVKFDETVPGGKYEVGGRMVDAEGKPLGKKKAEPAPAEGDDE